MYIILRQIIIETNFLAVTGSNDN